MVLESILSAREVEKQPIVTFFLGFGISSLAVWLAYYIFPKEASNWFLFLTSIALEPLIIRIFYIEEQKEEKLTKETLWERHDDVILDYLFLFFGMVISFSFWFTIVPQSISSLMFKNQISEIMRIQSLRTALTGGLIGTGAILVVHPATGVTAYVSSKINLFKFIFVNNSRLLFLFVAFSFLFGAGAILLLTWNAAVVGVAIGNLVKGSIVEAAAAFQKSIVYFKVLPVSFLAFFVHGIFEVLGYFVGAIAGGILSVSLVRRHYMSPHFNRVLLDVVLLFGLALILIVIGAFIEVYITPAL